MIFVDTNVLLDIATRDSDWSAWSLRTVQASSLQAALLINGVVYAELSVRYEKAAPLDDFLERAGTRYVDMPRSACFLAAKAFSSYKLRGGPRDSILPDFFIGAHASDLGIPLITRDTRRYRTYFPDLELVSPPLN